MIKPFAHRLAIASGLTRLRRRSDAAPVFCFHNVVADDIAAARGDSSLHMSISRFTAVVDVIATFHQVIPLTVLLNRVREDKSVAGLAAVTFDDAYRGVLANGLPILRRHGLHSSIFVVTDAAIIPHAFWWDVLGDRGAMTESVRALALGALKGITTNVLDNFPATTAAPLPCDLLPASWEEICESESPETDFGAHTASHANLTTLESAAQFEDVSKCSDSLRERLSNPIPVLAYPYGIFDERVKRATAAAGFTNGLALSGVRVRRRADPFAIPRINIPAGISPEAFECWAVELR